MGGAQVSQEAGLVLYHFWTTTETNVLKFDFLVFFFGAADLSALAFVSNQR